MSVFWFDHIMVDSNNSHNYSSCHSSHKEKNIHNTFLNICFSYIYNLQFYFLFGCCLHLDFWSLFHFQTWMYLHWSPNHFESTLTLSKSSFCWTVSTVWCLFYDSSIEHSLSSESMPECLLKIGLFHSILLIPPSSISLHWFGSIHSLSGSDYYWYPFDINNI